MNNNNVINVKNMKKNIKKTVFIFDYNFKSYRYVCARICVLIFTIIYSY